jgi:hypothetical protein
MHYAPRDLALGAGYSSGSCVELFLIRAAGRNLMWPIRKIRTAIVVGAISSRIMKYALFSRRRFQL